MIGWKDPDLDAEITLEEIHDVVKKLANGKAVGLDEPQMSPYISIAAATMFYKAAAIAGHENMWCTDAFRMLTVAYGEATLDRSNVYRWYKMFSEGREDVNDEERAGRPSTSTTDEKINEVEKMILANRRITVIEVAEDLNISIGSCHSIFINDLGMRRVAAKFVPKLLNCDQKQHRMNIANEMLDSVRDDPNLFQRVITGDEADLLRTIKTQCLQELKSNAAHDWYRAGETSTGNSADLTFQQLQTVQELQLACRMLTGLSWPSYNCLTLQLACRMLTGLSWPSYNCLTVNTAVLAQLQLADGIITRLSWPSYN
ncbi:hypothetical protein LAZ67_16002498 [Cordylochernes scorpioides]|uniref:Uncharacterized protein n=1 Tax=Cordylochernes scorpioides TaxID=51811 RepID=A0ABY6LEM7_9ARAC|nr:hypothetical protein LAZ67_16002498 [Cordylochernes scorpioides]